MVYPCAREVCVSVRPTGILRPPDTLVWMAGVGVGAEGHPKALERLDEAEGIARGNTVYQDSLCAQIDGLLRPATDLMGLK